MLAPAGALIAGGWLAHEMPRVHEEGWPSLVPNTALLILMSPESAWPWTEFTRRYRRSGEGLLWDWQWNWYRENVRAFAEVKSDAAYVKGSLRYMRCVPDDRAAASTLLRCLDERKPIVTTDALATLRDVYERCDYQHASRAHLERIGSFLKHPDANVSWAAWDLLDFATDANEDRTAGRIAFGILLGYLRNERDPALQLRFLDMLYGAWDARRRDGAKVIATLRDLHARAADARVSQKLHTLAIAQLDLDLRSVNPGAADLFVEIVGSGEFWNDDETWLYISALGRAAAALRADVEPFLDEEHPDWLRIEAVKALTAMGLGGEYESRWREMLDDENRSVRAAAYLALDEIGAEITFPD